MRGKLSVGSIVDLIFRGGFNPLRAERSWLLAGATLCGTVALFWAGGPADAQVCAHGLCEEGAALNNACDPCVADICDADSFCCEFDWDNTCVEEVLTVCGDPMCLAACEHSLCAAGGALDATCHPCVTSICAQDPLCCSSQWDSACIAQVLTVCRGSRGPDFWTRHECLDGSDRCRDAIPISADTLVFSSLVGMSSDGCASVGDSCQSADIWYSYTKSDADESINTCATQRAFGIDTVLSIHSGCPGQSNSEVIADDDWKFGADPTACVGYDDPNLLDSGVVLSLSHLAEGETAFIRVSHHADSAEGPFNLRVIPEPSTTVGVLVGWAWLLVLHRFRIHRQGQSRRGS